MRFLILLLAVLLTLPGFAAGVFLKNGTDFTQGSVTGTLPTYSGTFVLGPSSLGANGTVLTSNGSSPVWSAPAAPAITPFVYTAWNQGSNASIDGLDINIASATHTGTGITDFTVTTGFNNAQASARIIGWVQPYDSNSSSCAIGITSLDNTHFRVRCSALATGVATDTNFRVVMFNN